MEIDMANPAPTLGNLKPFTRKHGEPMGKPLTARFTIEQTAHIEAMPDRGAYLRALVQADMDRAK
jgi:hypothetical protein